MSLPIYAWIYRDPFHATYLKCTTTLSVLSNGLLLYIIFSKASSSMGPYRYLLAIFTVCDIITSFAHMFIQAILHMTRNGVYFFPQHGPFIFGGKSYDTLFCYIFAATFFQTFIILAYHFVFRYKAVTRGLTRSFTDNWTTLNWIGLGIIVNIAYIAVIIGICGIAFAVEDEMREIGYPELVNLYDIDLRDPNRGFIVIAVRRPDPITGAMAWHARSATGALLLFLLFIATCYVILFCIWQIKRVIRENHMATKTKHMQIHLFRALLIQTAVPIIFSYLPSTTIMVFPALTNISLGAFGNVLFSITAIFPSIDAFFILFFISRFRIAVIRLFRLPFDSNIGSSMDNKQMERSPVVEMKKL